MLYPQIYDLYTSLPEASESGLGFIDSSRAVLEIELDISPSRSESQRSKSSSRDETHIVQTSIRQSVEASSRKGESSFGSAWRSSLHLAQNVLRSYFYRQEDCFLDLSLLRTASVLELGSGTGVLAKLLLGQAPDLVSLYTASDREESLKLLCKNLSSLSALPSLSIEEIDWLETAKAYRLGKRSRVHYDLILCGM